MGQTAEKEERAFRQAPHSQVPFTLLVGGNHNHAAAVRASAVCGGAQRIRPDRSSGLEPLSESSHYQAVQKTKSNVTSPIDLFRTVFLCAAVDAHCAQSLTAHTLTIGRWQVASQQIHETRVLHDVSGSGDPDELERLSGFWFRWRRATRTESLVSSQALKTWPGQSSRLWRLDKASRSRWKQS